jgi:hypothetical protein
VDAFLEHRAKLLERASALGVTSDAELLGFLDGGAAAPAEAATPDPAPEGPSETLVASFSALSAVAPEGGAPPLSFLAAPAPVGEEGEAAATVPASSRSGRRLRHWLASSATLSQTERSGAGN